MRKYIRLCDKNTFNKIYEVMINILKNNGYCKYLSGNNEICYECPLYHRLCGDAIFKSYLKKSARENRFKIYPQGEPSDKDDLKEYNLLLNLEDTGLCNKKYSCINCIYQNALCTNNDNSLFFSKVWLKENNDVYFSPEKKEDYLLEIKLINTWDIYEKLSNDDLKTIYYTIFKDTVKSFDKEKIILLITINTDKLNNLILDDLKKIYEILLRITKK